VGVLVRSGMREASERSWVVFFENMKLPVLLPVYIIFQKVCTRYQNKPDKMTLSPKYLKVSSFGKNGPWT
jgi:hypothetical protein